MSEPAELPARLEDELAEILFRGRDDVALRVDELSRRYPEHAGAIRDRARSSGFEPVGGEARRERPERPDHIGPWRIVRTLGEGGFGVVYLAERDGRRVALKVLRPGMDSRRVLASFEQERRVLAALDHPCVARMQGAGTTESGHAWFVMDFIDGQPLTSFCDAHALDLERRLALFVRVCHGVQHAHQRAVLHRDLKPRNILVEQRDGEPLPRIIDFGLARALDPDLAGDRSTSGFGERGGTLLYMSPEQLARHRVLEPGRSIDTRTDVYSLGTILFELLTGCTPFPRTPEATIDEVERQIVEDTPRAPSALVPPGRSSRSLRELDWIVLRALEKEPDRRYASALDLARDVERFLRCEPVEAVPPTLAYRCRKFVRRHRAGVAAGALVVLSLVGGGIGTAVGFVRAADQRDVARRIAAFHLGRLRAVDAQELGLDLRAGLLDQVRKARAAAGGDEGGEEVERHLRELEAALAGADFTTLALGALDRAIFQPSLDAISERFTADPLLEAELLQSIATTLRDVGLQGAARRPQARALELRRAALPADHDDVLASMLAQAALERSLGETELALELVDRVIDGRTRTRGPRAPETLDALHEKALVRFRQDAHEEACALHRRVFEARRAVLGDEAPDTLTSLTHLAGTLRALGDLAGALPLHERALEAELRLHGERDRRTQAARNNLALTLDGLGRRERALELLERAYDVLVETVGAEHPDALRTAENLAMTLARLGRLDEALAAGERMLAVRARVLGPDHPMTLAGLRQVGNLHVLRREPAQAEEALAEALDGYRRRYGDRDTRTLNAQSELAGALYAGAQLDRARELQEGVLDVLLEDHGEEHPQVLPTMTNLAWILHYQGEQPDAVALLERALELCGDRWSESGPNCAPIVEALEGVRARGPIAPPE